MSERLQKIIIPLAAMFAHIGAYFQFQLNEISGLLPSHWKIQFLGLLVFSMLLSLLPLFSKKAPLIWTILTFQSLVLIIIGLPMGGYLGVELTILTVLIIQCFVYTGPKQGLIYSSLILIIEVLLQHPFQVWGKMLPDASNHDIVSMVIYVTFIILLCIILHYRNHLSFKELNRRLNEATLRLAETNIQLQEYASIAERQAIVNERKRMGREIHDSLGYTLTNLVMMLEAALDLSKENIRELPEHLERTRDQAKEGLAEVRKAIQTLRPIQYEITGLSAIQNLINAFTSATHLDVELNLGDAPLHFGEEADWAAYRLIQEGITNAIRHGKATRIFISLFRKDDGVGILIQDNGEGTEYIEEGYGLIGMRERIERLGGSLTVSSKSGEGFKLSALIPLDN